MSLMEGMVINMLDILKKKNPDIEFYSVQDEEFKSYGRIITNLDTSEIVAAGEKIELPEEGVSYTPTEKSFEKLAIAGKIRDELFGTLPLQLGYCRGHSSFLNATEWHTSSEINIAITPLVLFLGHVWEIEDRKIASSKFKAFYLPKGTAIECYATTLHYCPCQVSDTGFGCAVGLPEGTNTALEKNLEDKRISAKNKWILYCEGNKAAIARGAEPAITGINYQIKY